MPEIEFLEIAKEAALAAGAVLKSWEKKFTVREKKRADLVTEADLAAQDTIFEIIHDKFPNHNFLGEEDLLRTNDESPYCWVIDPLDGTSNYVHHFPYYAVSIGLACDDELHVGVIFDPNRDEMFSAVRSRGAKLNGEPIRPTEVDSLKEAMVVASLPVGCSPDDPAVARFLRVIPHAQTVQRTGSAALNLAYVAAGRLEGYWASSLKPWDVAAGALIVAEAGGRITKMDGRPFEYSIPDLLSSNGSPIHEELQELLT